MNAEENEKEEKYAKFGGEVNGKYKVYFEGGYTAVVRCFLIKI